MTPDNLVFQAATWIIPLVIAIVLHEISHGWVANAFGDPGLALGAGLLGEAVQRAGTYC